MLSIDYFKDLSANFDLRVNPCIKNQDDTILNLLVAFRDSKLSVFLQSKHHDQMVRKSTGRRKKKYIFPIYAREWIRAAAIAIMFLILFRYFVFDLVSLPDSSMERTLLPGDVLIVNKYNYGSRAPLRILPQKLFSAFFSTDSLVPVTQLPYWRLPGNRPMEQNDIVLVNLPVQHQKPVDKRMVGPRRLVAMAGDSVEIKNSRIIVNGNVFPEPVNKQQNYLVESRRNTIDPELLAQLTITEGGRIKGRNTYIFPLTQEKAGALKKTTGIRSVTPFVAKSDTLQFPPFGPVAKKWSIDNFGPLEIPGKGYSIDLNPENLALYLYHIVYHERRKVQVVNDSVFINDRYAEQYTFRMNYYFVVGDNHHNTSDSRNWGLLPENHIKGRVSGIFLSFNKGAPFFRKVRWERTFLAVE
jgi:signal peptidase I